MRRILYLLALIQIVLTPVQAAPDITVNTRYYPIHGNDSESIRKSIQLRGPLGKNGKRFHASTQWNIKWNYRWIESSGRCQINQIDVAIEIDMLMPQLKNKSELEAEREINWDRYYQALLDHEQHHKQYGIAAAHELENRLQKLKHWLPCNELEKTANDRANAVIDKYDKLEKEFDLRTDHGAKQGVTLP